MEVKWLHRDVAKSRNFEHIRVGRVHGHIETSYIRLLATCLLTIVLDDAELSDHAAAHDRAVVAAAAAGVHERPGPLPLRLRQRFGAAVRYSSKREGVISVSS
jgi:hypothetical protein